MVANINPAVHTVICPIIYMQVPLHMNSASRCISLLINIRQFHEVKFRDDNELWL